MPSVSVTSVKEIPADEYGFPAQLVIDCTIGTQYVRMGYPKSVVTSSAQLQAKLETDSAILLSGEKQKDNPFPNIQDGVTDRPELKPADFSI